MFAARAKRVIFLFMHGGPSSIDTFDPKPRLTIDHGKPVPFRRGLTFGEDGVRGLMKSPWEFKQYGQSGIPVSDLFPNIATCVDDLCVVRSMVGDGVDHGAALLQLHTGVFSFRRPSMGSWILQGLGTENQNLPVHHHQTHSRPWGQNNWSSSFLPGEYQGTPIGSSDMKIEEIEKEPMPWLLPKGLTGENQRFELDMIQKTNRRHSEQNAHDPDLEARIGAMELAFRMQVEAPEAFDLSKESEATRKLYALDSETTRDFGWQRLLARRISERGVRFVQCSHSYKWDQHSELVRLHTKNGAEVDKPIAGLLKDLKSRDLLKESPVTSLKTPSSFGVLSSAARRRRRAPTAAITISTATPCGWLAAASSPVQFMAQRMTSATTRSRTACMSTTCTPRFSPCSASTT
jgi:hypothetical protein